jgi:hypothetical protein
MLFLIIPRCCPSCHFRHSWEGGYTWREPRYGGAWHQNLVWSTKTNWVASWQVVLWIIKKCNFLATRCTVCNFPKKCPFEFSKRGYRSEYSKRGSQSEVLKASSRSEFLKARFLKRVLVVSFSKRGSRSEFSEWVLEVSSRSEFSKWVLEVSSRSEFSKRVLEASSQKEF